MCSSILNLFVFFSYVMKTNLSSVLFKALRSAPGVCTINQLFLSYRLCRTWLNVMMLTPQVRRNSIDNGSDGDMYNLLLCKKKQKNLIFKK